MAGMSLATTAFQKAAIGSTEIQKISIGTAEIWSAVTASYDTVAAGVQAFNSVSSFSITAAPGADVFVAVTQDRTSAHSSGVTCGGVAMTPVTTALHNNSSINGGVAIYRRAGAGTGSALTIVTGAGTGWMIVNAISFAGVSSMGTPTSAFGSGTSVSHAVSLPGPVGLSVFSGGANGGPTTQFGSFSGVTNRFNLKATGSILAINTVTASGTISAATNNPWASVFVPLS
ncbi:hypothetical protein SEA_PINKPLASTIC_4 [Mycobacterium phage PinkPlastic]|nr:hypothetical protein SEA_PINKPLASTIC_4 [Mycobacterium phage PinkPlastic]